MSGYDTGTDGILYEVPSVQKFQFEKIVRQYMTEPPRLTDSGIGTYQEKRMHAIIKHFLCEDESCHERKLIPTVEVDEHAAPKRGSKQMVADVIVGSHAYEVQTGSFFPLRDKIHFYLWQTDLDVTVICPIAATKYISWIHPETGEISKRSKSPKKGSVRDLLKELYWLKDDLGNSRLRICAMFLDVEEFRLLNGWDRSGKRGSSRYERIPVALDEVRMFESPADYESLIPKDLPECFKASEFAKQTGITGRTTYGTLQILMQLGLIRMGEKEGRAQTYLKTGAI